MKSLSATQTDTDTKQAFGRVYMQPAPLPAFLQLQDLATQVRE